MEKIYRYLGPGDLLNAVTLPERYLVVSECDVFSWLKETRPSLDIEGGYVATFIIDLYHQLWIADRHSEHIHCARFGDVLSAGEITFTLQGNHIVVTAITNQSTGFCPEPESWIVVQEALTVARLASPDRFTTAFEFRRCPECHSLNIVKDAWFVCSECESDLPIVWNL